MDPADRLQPNAWPPPQLAPVVAAVEPATTTPPPAPPRGLKADGRRLWESIVGDHVLDGRELGWLLEACRAVDQAAACDRAVARSGLTTVGSRDQVRSHPLLAEGRYQRQLAATLLARIDLRPEPSVPATGRSNAARRAAEARWGRVRRAREAEE